MMWQEKHALWMGVLIGLQVMVLGFGVEPPATNEITKSFCTSETFEAPCKENQIIIIKSALYGRMRAGDCISNEYAHTMGCYADVTSFLETECSGKPNCQVVVGTLDRVADPCSKDFKSYLEVTYQCAPVSYADECPGRDHSVRLTNRTGYLSLQLPQQSSESDGVLAPSFQHGTVCPWVLEAGPGQRINITAMHFSRFTMNQPEEDFEPSYDDGCPMNVVIKEAGVVLRTVDICEVNHRDRLIYSSKKNVVEVSLDVPYMVLNQRKEDNLLLKYQMYGCTDIIPPEGATSRRNGDTTIVSCNETQEIWYITCQRDVWIGSPGNCSNAPAMPNKATDTKPTAVSFRYGILIAVLVGIVLGTFVGGALLFVVYLFRRSKKSGERSQPEDIQYETRTRVTDSTCSYPALLCQEKQCGDNMSEYTHVWNMRAPTICSEGPYALQGDRAVHKDCHSSKASNVSKPSFERINMSQRSGDKGRVSGRDTPMYFEFDSSSRPNPQCTVSA